MGRIGNSLFIVKDKNLEKLRQKLQMKKTPEEQQENVKMKDAVMQRLSTLFTRIKIKNEFENQAETIILAHIRKWPEDRNKVYESHLLRDKDTCIDSPTFLSRKTHHLDQRNRKRSRKFGLPMMLQKAKGKFVEKAFLSKKRKIHFRDQSLMSH